MTKVDKYKNALQSWRLPKPKVLTVTQEFTCELERSIPADAIKNIRCREIADKFANVLYDNSETCIKEVSKPDELYLRGVHRYETTVIVMSPDEWKVYEDTAIRVCIGDLVNMIYQDMKKEFEEKIGRKLAQIKNFYNQLLCEKE